MAAKPSSFPFETTISSRSSDNEQIQNGNIDFKKGVKHLVDTASEMKKLPPQFVLNLDLNPLAVRRAEIPVIDLSRLGGCESRVSSVKAIRSACAQWGFFRIVNHGIEMGVIEEMLGVMEEFFDMSLEEKMKYASDDVLSPVRYGTSLNSPVSHRLHWRDYFRHYGHPVQESFHLWPNKPTRYRKVAKEYLKEIWELVMKIGGVISESLGLDPAYIERSLGTGCQILAANLYPPCPEPEKTLGLAAHSDHGALTILMQNDVNGLQVKHNQEWVAVPHVPGTFVVNIGDFLEILSNGKYKSVEHRAVVNGEKTRISVAVGHGPELSTIVRPASPLVNETEEIRYRPIAYKDYIRLQQSSTIRGKTSLQALTTHEPLQQNG